MRVHLVAVLLIIFCASLTACSNPVRTARSEVDRISRSTLAAEARFKRLTQDALVQIAEQEGKGRGEALRQAGCPSAVASQPASAPAICHAIAVQSQERYRARQHKVTIPAAEVDRAFGAVWASLLVVVDLLQDIDAGVVGTTWRGKLLALINEALTLYRDAMAAYGGFRELLGGAP
jgi:hypothetical protein